MKKHKFLSIFAIMFVLVFALSICFFAACGSDDDSKDNDADITNPEDEKDEDESEDDETTKGEDEEKKNDDNDDDADDDADDDGQTPGATVLDTRICSADEDDVFTFDGVTYFDATDLTITPTAGEGDAVNYEVTGTANLMNWDQADSFWYGVAARYDAYICYKIQVKTGETISYKTTSDNKSYTNSEDSDARLFDGEYLHMVARISGDDGFGGELSAKDVTYTISDGETTTDHVVSFEIDIPDKELPQVSVNFDNPETYSWIAVSTGGEAIQNTNTENPYRDSERILYFAPLSGNTTINTQTDGDGNKVINRLATGNASTTGNGKYFWIDLTEFAGDYVTVEVEMSNTGNQETRSLILTTEMTASTEAGTVLAYVSSTADSAGHKELEYTMKIPEDCTLYLTCDAAIYIYNIDITISDKANTAVTPTFASFVSDGAYLENDEITLTVGSDYETTKEESPVTGTVTAVSRSDHNLKYEAYDAYTWSIVSSVNSEGVSINIIEITKEEDGGVSITALEEGTATLVATLEDNPEVTATLTVTVSQARVTHITLDNLSYIGMDVNDDLNVIVTMSDGSTYSGKYIWKAGESNPTNMDGDPGIVITHDDETSAMFHMTGSVLVAEPGRTLTAVFTLTLDDGSTYTLTMVIDDAGQWTVTETVDLSWQQA